MRLILWLFCFFMTVPITVTGENQTFSLKSKEYSYQIAVADYRVAYARFQEAKTSMDKSRTDNDNAWGKYQEAFKNWLKVRRENPQEGKRLKPELDLRFISIIYRQSIMSFAK